MHLRYYFSSIVQLKDENQDISPTNFIFHALKIFKIPILLEIYGYAKSIDSSCMSLVWQTWRIGSDELVTRSNLDISIQYMKSL